MKKARHNIVIFILMMILLLPRTITHTHAYTTDKHNEYLNKVLFGEMGYSGAITRKTTNTINALEWASFLAIDQAKAPDGSAELANLNALHIPNLPKKVTDFSLTNIFYGNHRKYTHKGWDYTYENDNDPAKWVKIRKIILLSTVNKMFDFGLFSSKLFGYDEKCNSFAALIYYVHIVGDLIYNEGEEDENIMTVGNTEDDQNVIDELEKHLKILFSDTPNNRTLQSLLGDLSSQNREIEIVQFQMNDKSDDERAMRYKEISENIMNTLIDYVPKLLKEEKFFKDVFYPEAKPINSISPLGSVN